MLSVKQLQEQIKNLLQTQEVDWDSVFLLTGEIKELEEELKTLKATVRAVASASLEEYANQTGSSKIKTGTGYAQFVKRKQNKLNSQKWLKALAGSPELQKKQATLNLLSEEIKEAQSPFIEQVETETFRIVSN